MVFVTTDPARDTPSVIQTWLGQSHDLVSLVRHGGQSS